MKDLEARPNFVDTSRLRTGMVIKGYKGMCKVLGVKELKSRSSRQLQEADWRRYFEWEDLDHNYLRRIIFIKEFPDIVPPPPNAVYVKLIEMMVVCKLAKTQSLEIERTWPELFVELGLLNDNYKFYRTYQAYDRITREIRDVSKVSYADWGQRARGGIKRKIRSALDSMQRRQLIIWNETLYFVTDSIELDEKGKEKTTEAHCIAGAQEKAIKTEASRYILVNEYHMDNEDQIIAAGKYYEYLDKVNDYLYSNYKIHRFYNKVRISYDYYTVGTAIDATRRNLKKVAEQYDYEVKWEELTQMLIEMLNADANNKHNIALDKLKSYPTDENGYRDYKLPDFLQRYVVHEADDYVIEQELFSQYFVSKHEPSKEELIEKYSKYKEMALASDDIDLFSQN